VLSRIPQEETFVAKEPCILKICSRSEDYVSKVYFLKRFTGVLPISPLFSKISISFSVTFLVAKIKSLL
jgi:hypothetical protein